MKNPPQNYINPIHKFQQVLSSAFDRNILFQSGHVFSVIKNYESIYSNSSKNIYFYVKLKIPVVYCSDHTFLRQVRENEHLLVSVSFELYVGSVASHQGD